MRKEIKKSFEEFLNKNNRYPLYVKDFLNKENNLIKNYDRSRISVEQIKKIYTDLYGENFFNYQYIFEESKRYLKGENKKTMKFSVLNEKNDRMTILFLYNFFREKFKKYPKYSDLKKMYYFPFIVGINSKDDLKYENLFKPNEIYDFISKEDYKELIRNTDFEKIQGYQEEYERKNTQIKLPSMLSEEIIKKSFEIIQLKKYTKFSSTAELEEKIGQFIKDPQAKDLFLKEKNLFLKDINAILSLVDDINDFKLIDLNENHQNYKGYDFCIKNILTNDFISYKFKRGRASSNLSLLKLFGKNFGEIIREDKEQFQKARQLSKEIDKYIYENHLKKEYESIQEIQMSGLKGEQYKEDENFIEQIYDFLTSEEYKQKFFSLNKEKDLKNITINEFYEVLNGIFLREIISSFTDLGIKNKVEFINKYQEIKEYVLNKTKKLEILNKTLFYEELKEKTYKMEYKHLIKEYYRDPFIMKQYKEKFHKDGLYNYDKKIFSYFYKNFKEIIKNKERELERNDILRAEFLKYVLHLEIDDLNKGRGYVISEGVITEVLNYNSIKKYISDISINIDNLITEGTGYAFDLEILFKEKKLLKFKKNQIKSKRGKFTEAFGVDFSTNIELNRELLKEFNNQNIVIDLEVKKDKKEELKSN